MNSYKEIFISPDELRKSKVLFKQVVMKNNDNMLIKGKVLDEFCKPMVGVVIELIQIDNNYYPILECNMGYVVTNNKGEYAIVVEKLHRVDYRLDIYEPLIKL